MAGLQISGRPEHIIISTSTALVPAEPRPAPVVHDVNGYYARLGVAPTATKREIREAYQALDGQSDVELTEILRVLINRERRAAYDRKPPGSTFIDRAAVDTILRQAAIHAARENAEFGTGRTARDIIETLAEETGNPVLHFLASGSADGFDDGGTRDRHPSSDPPAAWPYSYLLLASTCDDVDRMARWREGLAQALAGRGCTHFAVGFHAVSDQPFIVERGLGIPVVFLHEEAMVTGELITAAATAVVA
ncbi:hypothetical protein AB0E08_08075 [Streptomyces sp. NPDC048281]|uniref:J domain-containing protein n=1 Tax=Streptomyces sp. NPDC048281 TaxID=3154715 RepID=UPI0034493D54